MNFLTLWVKHQKYYNLKSVYLYTCSKIKKNPSKEPDNIDTPNNGTDDESSEEECAINYEEIWALEYESDSEEFDSSTVCKRI